MSNEPNAMLGRGNSEPGRRRPLLRLVLLGLVMASALVTTVTWAAKGRMVRIASSTFEPPYPTAKEEQEVRIPAFLIDEAPVTNGQFLGFVKKHAEWRRDGIPSIFADDRYLSHWAEPTALGKDVKAEQPVTFVSWFAARAYCKSRGARLPREHEWEYLAQASAKQPNAQKDPAFLQSILSWYSKPTPKVLPTVKSNGPNYFGVYDLHGLVWEWVADFGTTMVSSDSREGGSLDGMRFCGGTAITQDDKSDYARFMRYAYRSSLQAAYTVGNLGFRCAKDAPEVVR